MTNVEEKKVLLLQIARELKGISLTISSETADILYNLINRQKAEIERLKNELHGKVEYIHEQREVIEEKRAEIERLNSTVKSEDEVCEMIKTAMSPTINALVDERFKSVIKLAKVEAIRDFTNRLIDIADLLPRNAFRNDYKIGSDELDNLIEEMGG